MSAHPTRNEEIMEEAQSSQSLSDHEEKILSLYGPIDILYIDKDGSWRIIHNVLMAIFGCNNDSSYTVGRLMLIINLSESEVPNLIAYHYQLYPGFTTVFGTPSNALILLDYDNLNSGIVLLLPPTSMGDGIIEILKNVLQVNFLEDPKPKDEDRKSAASRVSGLIHNASQAKLFVKTKVTKIAPLVREKAVGAFSSFLEGFERSKDETSFITPEMMNLIREFYTGSSLMAQGASTLMLTSGQSLRYIGSIVEPHAKWAAANFVETFWNLKAEEANEVVNETTKVIKHSGLFVIAMSEALLCVTKNFSAIPIDCLHNLIEHFYGATVADAWMKATDIKKNLEQAKEPIKIVGEVEDLFKKAPHYEKPKKQ